MSTTESAEQVRWDLSDLVADGGEQAVEALLAEGLERAGDFAQRYRGALETIAGDGLVAAMTTLAEIFDLVGRVESYARLTSRPTRPTPHGVR